jgi:hypothetical protein
VRGGFVEPPPAATSLSPVWKLLSLELRHRLLFAAGLALGLAAAGAAPLPAALPAGDGAEALELPRPLLAHPPRGYVLSPEGERWRLLERQGVVPRPPLRPESERRAEEESEASPAALRRARAEAAWRSLLAAPGQVGAVTRSDLSGVPHRARVAGLRAAAGPLDTQASAEAAGRAFLLAHRDLLLGGESPSEAEMPLLKAHRVGELWFLVFGQRHAGLEVIDGRVDVRLRRDGAVPLFGSQWFPGVDAARTPLVQRAVAEVVARAAVTGDPHQGSLRGADLAILPVPAGDDFAYRLVHRVRHASPAPLGVWTTLVDAEDGVIWARENALRHYDLSGTVTADFLPAQPSDPFEVAALPHTVVRRAADSTFTSLAGAYLLSGVTAGEPITTALRGLYMELIDATGPEGSLSNLAPGASPLDFHWTFAGGDTAEGTAYYHGLLAHDYVKALDGGLTAVDYRMPCLVNINATCNAFWDGVGINFFRTGNGCANTGQIADVVYHEYGHGVTQFTFDPLAPNGAMHEGFSDYLAATMTRQPVIGRGFTGPGTSIRTCDNTRTLPAPECLGQVHCLGTAISGALWDLQGNLALSLGDSTAAQSLADQLWHFAGYGGAYWYDDYLLDLLLVDDDDGTLLNGTPHFGDICSAFEAHGLPCPDTTSGVWIVHDPLPDADPGAVPYAVSAEMGSFATALAPGEQLLFYRVNEGGWVEVALAPGGGDLYEGSIPALPSGGRVDYYLGAGDAGGLSATHPAGAPGSFHTFFVGAQSVVFTDDFETDQGWEANGGNTALTGYWKRVDPNGTADGGFVYQPEDDHTPDPGVVCFVTGDTTAGLQSGTADVDGGCVYLVSPRLALSGLSNARLEYWRWFTNENRLDDSLFVAVSGDDGASWALLEVQPYTQNEWLSRSFDLGSRIPLTDSVRLRVWTCDGGGGSLTEAALDDVLVTTRQFEVVEATPPPAVGLHLAQSLPNPTTGEAVIAFGVPGGAGASTPVSLRLYDARGRLVRTLVADRRPPGAYRVAWNGRDEAGRRVAPGTYLYLLQAAGEELSRKLVLTR